MSLNNTYAFLTVRTSSSRLPEKCFLPFGGTNVLGHVINRTVRANFIPIVCTSIHETDDRIENFCKINNIKVFRGVLKNKLQRWMECADFFKVDYFHTIDVDDPFFEPKLVSESINLLISEDLDVVYPTIDSANGSASVGYSIRVPYLNKVIQNISKESDIEMVDQIFDNFAGTKKFTLESESKDIRQVRLTLDYMEDYWLLNFLVRELGPYCTRLDLISFFNKNPDLYKINWFRNEEWAKNQNKIRTFTHSQGVK